MTRSSIPIRAKPRSAAVLVVVQSERSAIDGSLKPRLSSTRYSNVSCCCLLIQPAKVSNKSPTRMGLSFRLSWIPTVRAESPSVHVEREGTWANTRDVIAISEAAMDQRKAAISNVEPLARTCAKTSDQQPRGDRGQA